MELLKHGDFVFGHILSGGYNIRENVPDVISVVIMANGTIRRNYGEMPKTEIKVKFGQLNKETYKEYMSHFEKNEDIYSYFSPRKQEVLTKKFAVTFPENSLLFADDMEQTYEEFEVVLSQCGEV